MPRKRSVTSRRRQPVPFKKYLDCPSRVTSRLTAISAKPAYSLPARPSLLSNTSSIDARETGLRLTDPLNITSVIDSPRKCFALDSPITQRTASMTFDLPQPFGPTIAVKLDWKGTVVGSTNDLNPASLILFKRNGVDFQLIYKESYPVRFRVSRYLRSRDRQSSET